MIDKDGNVFLSNDDSNIHKKFTIFEEYAKLHTGNLIKEIGGVKCNVTIEDLQGIQGKIISIVPQNKLFSELQGIRRFSLLVLFASLILLSIPFFIIINNILCPLKKFMTFIQEIKSGNLKGLKKRIELEGYTEMGVMAEEFNDMLDEIDNLTHKLLDTSSRLYETEIEKKQSELAFLRSQINPHFLYNTLESIIGMAAVEGNDKVVTVAKCLGQIFRFSVKGEDHVTLEEELEIVKSFINIHLIRFEGRFEVFYHFPKETLDIKVPKMVLQPIVENSIYHGLEPKLEKGHLFIDANIDNDNTIVISVRDDGIGMNSEVLEDIRNCLQKEASGKKEKETYKTGIGIINVHNRIKLAYGKKYGITIDSNHEEGTRVILNIPAWR